MKTTRRSFVKKSSVLSVAYASGSTLFNACLVNAEGEGGGGGTSTSCQSFCTISIQQYQPPPPSGGGPPAPPPPLIQMQGLAGGVRFTINATISVTGRNCAHDEYRCEPLLQLTATDLAGNKVVLAQTAKQTASFGTPCPPTVTPQVQLLNWVNWVVDVPAAVLAGLNPNIAAMLNFGMDPCWIAG